MHYFVAAGILGCRKFACVLSVAEYLEKKYPYIIFHRIFVKHYKWKEWLKLITNKNGWNHFSLPIIWKEIPFRGGKQSLVGGYNGFMEYCSEMYNVEISFTSKKMKHRGFEMLMKEIQYEEVLRFHEALPRQVCIYGAGSVLAPLFLPSLLSTSGLANCKGLILGFYDEDVSKKELVESIVEEFSCIVPQDSCKTYFAAHIINNIVSATKNCDLFILVIPEFHDLKSEYKECWSQSVSYATRAGRALASVAKDNVRVILVPESIDTPVCLCAAAFAQAAMPNVLSQNVVAVTTSIGIMVRSMLAYSLQVPMHIVKEVPVWGFTGVSHLLDPSLTITDEESLNYSELAQQFQSDPIFKRELLKSYLWPLFGRRKETVEIMLKRKPYWATVEAMVEIVHKWYSQDSKEKRAFLGICSDGTFGIPPGIYFSQPTILIGGIWKPLEEHSLPTDLFCKVEDLCNTAVLLTEIYLKKEKCKYRLTGLDVEENESYFIGGKIEVKNKLGFTSCEIIEESYHLREAFVLSLMKELMNKVLANLRLETLLPCFFPPEDSYNFIVALIKESIQIILHEEHLQMLIPCLFSPDDIVNFVTGFVKDSLCNILANMKKETLIPCIFPHDDIVNFITTFMKESICNTMANMKKEALIPCIFPHEDIVNFVTTVIKDSISNVLANMKKETLIPCIFPDDTVNFVTSFVKESICKILANMKKETLIPCLFPDDDTVNFVTTFVKESICRILGNMKKERLFPCIFPHDNIVDFVIAFVKDSICNILANMKKEMLIPCLFPHDDIANFVTTYVKDSICNILANMENETLISCIFPHDDTVNFVTTFVQESMCKILANMKKERLIPCIFQDNIINFVNTFMKESMSKVLTNMRRKALIPYIFPHDDVANFVTTYVKESMCEILTNMKKETFIPCLFPDDDTDFIVAIMKESMYQSLAELQQQKLIPCLFPWTENEHFVMELMKESMQKALSELQLDTFLPYMFPYNYIGENHQNSV